MALVIYSPSFQSLIDKFNQPDAMEIVKRPEGDPDDVQTPTVTPLPAIVYNWITVGNLRSEVRRIITNPHGNAYVGFLTRESVCVHAIQQWCELAELWPDDYIIYHQELKFASDGAIAEPFLEAFYEWYACRLIWNAAMGPSFPRV